MLFSLKINQRVRIQDEETKRWNKLETIVKTGIHRKYSVRIANERMVLHNKKFLKLFEDELVSPNINVDSGGGIRRNRVTFQEGEAKTKEDHRLIIEPLDGDGHTWIKEHIMRWKKMRKSRLQKFDRLQIYY